MAEWQEQLRRQEQTRRDEVMSFPVLPLRHHGVIEGQPGDVMVCASTGSAGEAVAVWTAAADLEAVTSRTLSPAGASFPDTGSAWPVTARITIHDPGLIAVTRIRELTLGHITVQPMPGGRFLVAGARCQWHRDGPDPNAVLYDEHGDVVSQHVLGDGIAHLLATSTGEVWAGYFDEGIFGNYGWGQADTDEPIGAYGIVQFSPQLEPAWHFPHYTTVGPWDAICDCYALNVDDKCTWACYYADFPVVRIRDRTVNGWSNDIGGTSALAALGPHVALFGTWSTGHHRLALAELDGDHTKLAGQYRVVLPDGQPLPESIQVIGRGSRLDFIAGHNWYRFDISEILA
jgi:hypothetical protein